MKITATLRSILAASALMFATHAHSAVPQINGSGILTGATNVMVQGTAYNVTFVEGSCDSLFNGCASFTFNSEASATAASQALLDQVLLDGVGGSFDAYTDLTYGCSQNAFCISLTPFGTEVFSIDRYASTVAAVNFSPEIAGNNEDYVGGGYLDPTMDLSNSNQMNYAVWTVAATAPGTELPEPGGIALFGIALLGVAMTRRRAK